MTIKKCTKCHNEFPATTEYFHKQSSGSFGLRGDCKTCRCQVRKEFDKAPHRQKKIKEYYSKPEVKARMKSRSKARWADPKIRAAASQYYSEWLQSERGSRVKRYNVAARRVAKLQATPAWADSEAIREIYLNCPDGYEVDHVIPLKGENVCGLHVAANLQYLTPEENIKKKNKLLTEHAFPGILRK